MKTIEQIKNEYKSEALDGRDLHRLAEFCHENDLPAIGIILKDEFKGTWKPKKFTRKNVLAQLKRDVDFGFEKALDKRGISAWLMYKVVSMWNWILEDGLENFDDYAQYGLPLFKATAIKYGFDNPIGDDSGTETKYASD